MFVFIIRRLSFLPLVFFGVTIFIVLLMQVLSPYQRAAAFAQTEMQARNLDAIIEQYGLDDPWYQQYGRWLNQVRQGNLGYSRTSSEPVLTTLRRRFPPTLELALFAILPVIGVGIWLGTAAALNRDKLIDQFTRVLSILGWSLPTFVLGIWLLVIFYGALGWFEPGRINAQNIISIAGEGSGFERYTGLMTLDALLNGRFDIFWDALRHLVLPVITLAVVSSAQIMRVMRSALLEILSQDYVRTARAKGLQESVVNHKHARRNALIPVITLSGFVLIGLVNGVVITETIFNYPGLGQWAAQAAINLDYAAILGFAVFTAILVVLANLLVDVLYAVVDPRIRYD
ncbi:MAG: ABC transporter permease [Trueperaceae bacterium]|nr:MAG: ABC transporter permease [Trueperaceae bacterium]